VIADRRAQEAPAAEELADLLLALASAAVAPLLVRYGEHGPGYPSCDEDSGDRSSHQAIGVPTAALNVKPIEGERRLQIRKSRMNSL
jgi:hypothetical protein